MKKRDVIVSGLLIVFTLLITLFSNFDAMKLMPLTTADAFLASQPYVNLGNVIMTQPSSTIIVYVLGIFIIFLGIRFLKHQEGHVSRQYWGYAMIFWGIGTILAGTSYQAFGYQIKCVGKEFCNFTDWWEIIYLLMTGTSIGLMVIGMSHCIASGRTRKIMQHIAYISVPLYGLVLTIGSIVPIKVLVTYELFNLFFMPHFIFFFVLNIRNYRKNKDEVNGQFILIWLLFVLVNVSYYVYYWFGFSEILLSSTGIWFNQNDVLHVAILLWFGYIWYALPGLIVDID